MYKYMDISLPVWQHKYILLIDFFKNKLNLFYYGYYHKGQLHGHVDCTITAIAWLVVAYALRLPYTTFHKKQTNPKFALYSMHQMYTILSSKKNVSQTQGSNCWNGLKSGGGQNCSNIFRLLAANVYTIFNQSNFANTTHIKNCANKV